MDADTAPAAETPPRAPRHRVRGALPRAEAVRGSLEIVLDMLRLEDVAGATLLLRGLVAAHVGAVKSSPGRTRRSRRSGATARPHVPATEPGESGVALGVGTRPGGGGRCHPCSTTPPMRASPARPTDPATEPDASGVALRGCLVQGEADHATPCASASSPPAPPPSAALATVTPPPAEEPPPPTATTGVHGARN